MVRPAILAWFAPLAAGFLVLSSPVAAGDAGMVPHFAATARCFDKNDPPPAEVCELLHGTEELKAPPGGRVYRETWTGPVIGPMQDGSIVLTITPDGTRTLKTPWLSGAYRLKSTELADFEATLARSDFGDRPVHNQATPVCLDGVATALEAIVDGRYRLVYFSYCGGVSSEGIASALDQLFVLAASKAGLRYPFNPDHPTFRGR
jgi:hypothetical protein